MALGITSFVVLGLVDAAGEATPYELKRRLAEAAEGVWSVPHSQVYAEARRLAGSGHLVERREKGGRRRRTYSLSSRGSGALDLWRRSRSRDLPELRDPGVLQVLFGADVRRLAPGRLELHRRRLASLEARLARDDGAEPRGPWLGLRAATLHERASIAFWSELSE